jgi:hypothetical protein
VWSFWFCDTVTGVRQLQVFPSEGSWSVLLNAGGDGSHKFKLGERRLPRETWRALTTPWARTLVQCWNGIPRYAGVVTGRPYDRATQTLDVQHADVRTMFLKRYPFGTAGYWANEALRIPGTLTITGKSLRAAVGLVLQAGLTGPAGGAPYGLPIVLPSLTEAGTFSKVYENFNFKKVSEIIGELQDMDGGPDIDFTPRWSTTGALEWVARIGSPAVPALTGNTLEWHMETRKPVVSAGSMGEDALKQITGVYGVGRGTGPDIIVGGTVGAAVAAIPARDDHVKWDNADTIAEATSFARERLAANKYPTTEPKLKVRASHVDPNTLVLGSAIRLHDKNDPWLPDGWTDYRLLGASGGVDEDIALIVQGVRA